MNSCEHSPDGYHDASACSHCLRAALAEIERLNTELERYKRHATQRAARMQLLWKELRRCEADPSFVALASEWFYADGVPVDDALRGEGEK